MPVNVLKFPCNYLTFRPFWEITHPVKLTLGIIYRLPNSSIEDFLASIENIITSLHRVPIYIMGGFNVNLLNYKDNKSQDLINMLYNYSLFSTINKPTQVTSTSATLLDHIWTNNTDISRQWHIVYLNQWPFSHF